MRLGFMIALLLLPVGEVAAQPETLEADAPETARMRYRVGRHLYKQGRFEEAAREFEAALAMHPTSARFAYNLARCRERTGDRAGGAAAYRRYLALAPEASDRDDVEALVRLLEGPAALAPEPAAPPVEVEAPAPEPAPPGAPPTTRWLAWGVVAAGVVAAGSGAYFHVGALDTADDAGRLPPDEAGLDRHATLEEDFQGQQIGAGVGYAVGAVLLAVGITLLSLDDSP